MENRQTILQELQSVSPILLEIRSVNPYADPGSSYFENFPFTVLERIKAGEAQSPSEELNILSPFLGKIVKKTPFTVPEGYFQDLPSGIAEGAKAIDLVNEELESYSSILNGLNAINVYRVPDHYFNRLPELVLARVKQQVPAKLVSIGSARKFMRYAAAAVVAGAIILAGILFVNTDPLPGPDASASIIQQLSESEMVTYLESESMPLIDAASLTASADLTPEDMRETLDDVPDEVLQQYIMQYSDAKGILIN